MKQYDVKISRMALSDMEQIYSYIADRLLEPDTAMGQYNRIAEAIQSLNILPERCALVESEPERTQGLRQMLVDNYSVFYIVGGMPCRWPVFCTVHPTLCAACGE